ncbi:MAG: hypothetical protein AUJ12_08770 [Alphaproteobacteria bacterium CG1_02_46_17]|nr:MAG: hypothetical protein AUJ12_08770 [Alphaproteobacteria bacterium CG1_02_46_17]
MPKLPPDPIEEEHFGEDLRPRPLSRLTYKILSFNILVVFIIAMGITYLGTTRQNLIESKLGNFETESFLYSNILNRLLESNGFSENDRLYSEISLLNIREDQQIVLYTAGGGVLYKNGKLPVRKFFELKSEERASVFDKVSSFIEGLLSVTFHLQILPSLDSSDILSANEQNYNFSDIKIAAWSSEDGGLVLTSYFPLYKQNTLIGGIRIIRRDIDVEENFAETRMEIFRFFALALLMTVAHSLYLASLIGHPLRKLATAAEAYRLNRGRFVDIPDMSARQDEIGELSHAMREMADSLQKRLSTIEQFAADVAHELKNPLTSLRSALETFPRVKKEDDRQKLMGVALHDLQRMDRLISDISQASRLDVELSRSELFLLDLREIIIPLIESRDNPLRENTTNAEKKIIYHGLDEAVMIYGHSGRLEQVFQNLIGNALSFAPEGSPVIVTVINGSERVRITVDDSGPGIPENRMDKVFERFYSERPISEGFGMHSGLGLSIAKQIIDAHGGTISAENLKEDSGNILGARFTVRLKSAII